MATANNTGVMDCLTATDRLMAAREAHFNSSRYTRGDGKHQGPFEYFKNSQSNIRFNWLYEIHTFWHDHQHYLTRQVMERRGRLAGVDPALAKEVADTVYESCKRFFSVTGSFIHNKRRLVDVFLNDHAYQALAVQVLGQLTEFTDRLDAFMDTLLESIMDDYDETRRVPLLSNTNPHMALAMEDTPELHSPESPRQRLTPEQMSPRTDSDAEEVVKRRSSSTPSSPRSKHRVTPRLSLFGSLSRKLSPRDSLK